MEMGKLREQVYLLTDEVARLKRGGARKKKATWMHESDEDEDGGKAISPSKRARDYSDGDSEEEDGTPKKAKSPKKKARGSR